jgi:hypothetical protein
MVGEILVARADGEPSDAESSFCIGHREREHIRVWKDRAEVHVGRFSAEVSPYLRRRDVVAFRDGLKLLYDSLQGTTRFEDLEGVVSIEVTVTKTGHVTVHGRVRGDREGAEPICLEFVLQLDQTFLASTLRDLDEWLASEGAP